MFLHNELTQIPFRKRATLSNKPFFSVTTHRNLCVLSRHFLFLHFPSHSHLFSTTISYSLSSLLHCNSFSRSFACVHGGRRIESWIPSLSEEQAQILSLLLVLLPSSPAREAENRSKRVAPQQATLHRFPLPATQGKVLQLHQPHRRPPPPPPLRRLPLRRAQLRAQLRRLRHRR